ncbi:TPA: phage tail protein, partial [Salmonella enterica subsp. enterica serovar Senftenberg]|nr:phage tail protein [Salmonella enterica subsp. enterica serovar Senftenberg]HBJ7094247.1 phage tail protein [Salmonella enterica subsp. enterica serovar Senftenberg]
VEQAEEPQPPEPVTRPVELYVNGELVSRMHE